MQFCGGQWLVRITVETLIELPFDDNARENTCNSVACDSWNEARAGVGSGDVGRYLKVKWYSIHYLRFCQRWAVS